MENSHFTQLNENLHPGYKPPTIKRLGNEILDSVHSQLQSTSAVDLKRKNVMISMDGWTNVNGDPIISFCIFSDSKTNLLDWSNSTGELQTSEHFLEKLRFRLRFEKIFTNADCGHGNGQLCSHGQGPNSDKQKNR